MDQMQLKEHYHKKLVDEGYSVRQWLPFEGIQGKFALYAIHNKTGREKLIQVKDFSNAADAAPLMKSLEDLTKAKVIIELSTLARRTTQQSSLELELVAAGVKPYVNNDFCANAKNLTTEYRAEILHARILTNTYQPMPSTRRFVLTS